MNAARQLGSLLVLTCALSGCGFEMVDPRIEPGAVETPGAGEPLASGVVCQVEDRGGGTPLQVARRPAVDETLAALVAAVREGGVFKGAVTSGAGDEQALECDARLVIEPMSEPEILGPLRNLLIWTTVLLPPIGIPLDFIYIDLEPDLAERYTLQVGVRGEELVASYQVTARGTISAQLFGSENPGLTRARTQLRELGLRALVSRLQGDEAALAKLREQLYDGPPAELAPLLVTKESWLPRGRWRTRRLIAWKNESLETLRAESKTSQLRAMVSQLETCMLDLSHEAESSRNSAQALTASGGDANRDRELSLVYSERIEVLRPILTACKEELQNRGR